MQPDHTAGKCLPAWRGVAALLASAPALLHAGGVPTATQIDAEALEEIVVSARRIGLIGEARAASEGIVLAVQIEARPVLRPGEVLETVPGLVVTQHSGDGKANQYYLRGFNLDHGTDFTPRVDGIPVNMPTHGHGQGYADINFLIPELLEEVRYRKGTYYAEEGNFSAAGAADLIYRTSLHAPLAGVTVGEHDYCRALLAASPELGGGSLLLALDYSSYDGPWKLPQDFRKVSAIAEYSRGTAKRGWSVTGMGYDGRWDSTDQIPERAVNQGLVSRLGCIDPTDGGNSHRYSLSADGWSIEDGRGWRANAYAIDYGLELVSNFTYAIDETNGDQFEQYDQRRVFGGRFGYQWPLAIGTVPGTVEAGAGFRLDDIDPVGLYLTQAGRRYRTIREDVVRQGSYSAWLTDDRQWNDWLRIEAGLRYDYFDSDDNDITYYYESRLPGEPEPVSDIHFHPVEPRTLRATLTYRS